MMRPKGPTSNGDGIGVAVIVDPFSTGRELAPEFRRRGWRTIAVLSTPHLPSLYVDQTRSADFDAVIVHRDDLQLTAQAVQSHQPTAVLSGTEIGVELTDALADLLGVPSNGAATSLSRRHKGEMARMVAAAGLAVPRTTVAASEVDAVTWASDLGVPTVVKPVDSAGADGVTFCSTPVEVGKAFRGLHQRVNRMGKVNETVLVQETMEGRQYFINTVSRAGRHRVIEVWADQRRRFPDGVVCDREDLIPPGGRPQEALVAYVIKVLDALAIREGPAHTEVMLTASGPMLIECAARMQGTIVPEAVTAAIGENHVSATVTAASHPQAHDQGAERPYSLLQHLCVVSLIALRDGRMNERGIAGALPGLTTLHSVLSGTAPGQPVQRTVDLFTSPGYLYLLSPDSDQIERDYRRIREAEKGGLYQ